MPYLLCRSRTPFVKPTPWTSPFVRPRLSTSPFVRPRAPFVQPGGELGLRAAVGRLTSPWEPRYGSSISASHGSTARTSASAGSGRHGGEPQRHEDGAELSGEQVERPVRLVRLPDERDAEEIVEEGTEEQDGAAEGHV